MGLSSQMFGLLQVLAQVLVEPDTEAARDAAMVFSGPQFFTALVAGVLLAFAFQLLLTNLGIAAGISMLGGSSSSSDNSSDDQGGSIGGTIRKVGFALGLATLITVTISLFFACLFAVRLSLFVSVGSGAIVGLVIWATYFSLLVLVSSSTVGSLVGSIVNSATSGFQAVVGTAASALGGQAVNRQVVATAEAAASAVRRELGTAIDPLSIKENVEDYIGALKAPELDRRSIRSDFEKLLEDPSVQEIAGSEGLDKINRQTFVDIISSRSDLSKREVESLASELEDVWNRKVRSGSSRRNPMAELVDYIKSASADQLLGSEFTSKLDQLIEELRLGRQSQQGQQEQGQGQGQGQGPIGQALSMGMNSLMGMVMGRADLSDLDVGKITSQLNKLKGQAGEQTNKVTAQLSGDSGYSTIRADVENYIVNAYPWQLKQENLGREFRDLLYDPEADPDTVANEIEQISRSDFAEWLQQKGLYTQTEIRDISLRLEAIRREVLATARAASEREKSLMMLREVEQYLLTTPKEDLTPEKIQLNFKPILEDSDADYEHLSTRLAQFDRSTFERLLAQRGDMDPMENSAIVSELETARDRALSESQELGESAKAKAESQWLRVQSYLRDTGKDELNPQAIGQELKLLLDDPQAGASALRSRASRFDRDTLVQLLTQRGDLSEEQVNQTIDQVEGIWTRVRSTQQELVGKAQQQYDQTKSTLIEYLRSTGKDELNPEGIRRDLQKLFEDPQTGASAIRSRLASMDRDTLVQLLSQREDLSEEQVNQVINEVQSTLQSIARTPRRLARRAQSQVQSFQDSIANYLRSTDKEALNPDGIKRDLQLLLNDPRAGGESLSERLSQIDRETLVTLLTQRGDISEADVNGVIDQILSVRDQFGHQVRSIQLKIEAAIENVFDRIRRYLNGLERPELNYEGISRDLQTLFDDPQAGFEALRDRLSHVDRNTLVAIISSRDDISEADANRLFDRIENSRNRVLQRAERVQQETMRRVEQVKLEAQKQAEETRKAAAAASWWLFFTALVSAIASAGAGALGVIGAID